MQYKLFLTSLAMSVDVVADGKIAEDVVQPVMPPSKSMEVDDNDDDDDDDDDAKVC